MKTKMDETFTFANTTPLLSSAENWYIANLGCQPTAHKETWQEDCVKIKKLVRNPPPPTSPRLLLPGVDHLSPPCCLAGWRQAGETSSMHQMFPHLLYLVLSTLTPPISFLLFIRIGPWKLVMFTLSCSCLSKGSE